LKMSDFTITDYSKPFYFLNGTKYWEITLTEKNVTHVRYGIKGKEFKEKHHSSVFDDELQMIKRAEELINGKIAKGYGLNEPISSGSVIYEDEIATVELPATSLKDKEVVDQIREYRVARSGKKREIMSDDSETDLADPRDKKYLKRSEGGFRAERRDTSGSTSEGFMQDYHGEYLQLLSGTHVKRFWQVQVYKYEIKISYGTIGGKREHRKETFSSYKEAVFEAKRRVTDKVARGYKRSHQDFIYEYKENTELKSGPKLSISSSDSRRDSYNKKPEPKRIYTIDDSPEPESRRVNHKEEPRYRHTETCGTEIMETSPKHERDDDDDGDDTDIGTTPLKEKMKALEKEEEEDLDKDRGIAEDSKVAEPTDSKKFKRSYTTVKEMLGAIDLSHLAAVFENEEIDGGAFLLLDEGDLKELGISMGPRKKIMKSIKDNDWVPYK